MKYLEFKNGLKNGDEYAVYLFEGEDAYFSENGVSLIKNEFVSQPELNFITLPSESSVEDVIASLEEYPFMSKKRMVLLREFYPKQEQINKGLKKYLENPFEMAVLVIINQKPLEQLAKFSSVCVVDCSKADTSLLIKWVIAECSCSKVNINGETAKMLIEFCLSDMTRIKTETNKLISYVGENGEITVETVRKMVAQDLEYKIYELTDYIGKRDFSKALSIIKDMTAKGEPASRIISYAYNYFRRLLHISISDMEQGQIAKAFGVKEYAISKMKQQASLFKKRALKSAVDALSDADYKIKSGLCEADDCTILTIFKIMTQR